MILVIGLGNPGTEYERTRHNAGFLVLDELAKQCDCAWKLQKKLQAEVVPLREIPRRGTKNPEMILAKPQTFMNLSGISVQAILKHYSLLTTNYSLVIVHDDVDLPLGTIRVSHNASSGGHKGVQSIIDHLGTKEFWRIRVGIRPNYPASAGPRLGGGKLQTTNYKLDTPDFVLKKFSAEEKKKLPEILKTAAQLTQDFLEEKQKVQTIHL